MGAVILYLGTHEPLWLARSDGPLFVSLARSERFGRRPARGGWALDSGAFTQITTRGGWTITPQAYLSAVYELADRVGSLLWAPCMDWMCEPIALAATGLSVAEHQQRTVDSYCELAAIDTRGLIVPVLQGWAGGDHERCAELYAQAGVDLGAVSLVGIGSVCRRQATAEIAAIVRGLAAQGLRLHGFGIKSGGLARYGSLLYSADSLAWSFRARKAARHGEGPLGSGCTHASCQNCYRWAHEWQARVQAAAA